MDGYDYLLGSRCLVDKALEEHSIKHSLHIYLDRYPVIGDALVFFYYISLPESGNFVLFSEDLLNVESASNRFKTTENNSLIEITLINQKNSIKAACGGRFSFGSTITSLPYTGLLKRPINGFSWIFSKNINTLYLLRVISLGEGGVLKTPKELDDIVDQTLNNPLDIMALLIESILLKRRWLLPVAAKLLNNHAT